MDELFVIHGERLVLYVTARKAVLLRVRRRLGEPNIQVALGSEVLDFSLQDGGAHHGRVSVRDESALAEGARVGRLRDALAVHRAFEILLQDHDVVE